MKKNYLIWLISVVLLLVGESNAQEQQKKFINYQGVARDAENEPMEQEALTVGIALRFGSPTATIVYEESHAITTDANGVFSLQIGNGNVVSGIYDNLPWHGATFLTVSLNGQEVGTTELMAVPFAIASGDNQWMVSGSDIENKNEGVVHIKNDLRVNGGFNLSAGNQVNEISDNGTLSENSNGILPTQRAVKTYVDNKFFAGGGVEQNAGEVPYDNTASGLAANNAQEAIDELAAGAGGVDADADPTNELQNLTLTGTNLEISDGTGVDLSGIIPPGGTDDQTAAEVPFNNAGTGLAATDTQAALEELAAGGLVDTDDQDLSLTGTVLNITDGTGVDLSGIIPPGGTDDQTAAEVPFNNAGTGLAATDTQAALEELAAGGLVDTDNQDLSLTGTVLNITDGSGVDLSTIIPPGGTDDQNASEVPFDNTGTGLAAANTQAAIEELAAGGVVDTDDQGLIMTGDVLSIENGAGSVDLGNYVDVTGESGLLIGDGTNISGLEGTADGQVAKWDAGLGQWIAGTDEVGGAGGSSLWSESGDDIYFDSGNVGVGLTDPNAIHHVHADSYQSNSLYTTSDSGDGSNNGMYVGLVNDLGFGFTATIMNQENGPLRLGTNGNGRLIITNDGNVGIGISDPETKMHIGGNLFLQSNLGNLILGYPENGNQWRLGTLNGGATLQFRYKENGSNTLTTHFRMRKGGEFQFGDISTVSSWAHIRNNSTLLKPLFKLEETGNDYARLELTNDAVSDSFWHVAGLPSNTASDAKLNFYFRNTSGAGNRMTITGDGRIGVNTESPSARLTINQGGQSVGSGLSFSDNTDNQDWHITHGFGLRFHYGAALRGYIDANNGAYVQSSDKRLKSEIEPLNNVLGKVKELKPSSYYYKSDIEKKRTIGLIAQEVQDIFPDLVSSDSEDELLGLNYGAFAIVAIKAIQEQQSLIENQSKRIASLEARLLQIEKNISR